MIDFHMLVNSRNVENLLRLVQLKHVPQVRFHIQKKIETANNKVGAPASDGKGLSHLVRRFPLDVSLTLHQARQSLHQRGSVEPSS